MRFALMRLIDKHVGSFCCRILALCFWLCGRHIRAVDHPTPPAPGTVREILVVKFLGLGSILQATPLFQALRRRFPNARLTLLTFQANRGLQTFAIGVDALVTIDTAGPWRFVRTNLAALRQRLAERFSHVDFRLGEPLGRHPLLLAVVAERARQALGVEHEDREIGTRKGRGK